DYFPKGYGSDFGTGPVIAEQGGPGTGYGPLLVWTALSPVFGGEPVLPFRCGIMADRGRQYRTGKTPVQEHRTESKTEGGGGTGPVEAKKGDTQGAGGEVGGDNLV